MRIIILINLIFSISFNSFSQTETFDGKSLPITSPFIIGSESTKTFPGPVKEAKWYMSSDAIFDNFMLMRGFESGGVGGSDFVMVPSNRMEGLGMEGYYVAELVVSGIDLSAFTNPRVSFYLKSPDKGEILNVEASTNGVLFDDLGFYLHEEIEEWTRISIDLTKYAGVTNLLLRFNVYPDMVNFSYKNESNVGIDEITIEEQVDMQLLSTSSSLASCGMKQGYDDQKFMQVVIETTGSLNPLTFNKMNFDHQGSSTALDCNIVLSKKLYYTGKSSTFSTSNLVAESNLNKGDFSFSKSVPLSEGRNYFWLAMDVSSEGEIIANFNDTVGVRYISSSLISGNNIYPSTQLASKLPINDDGVFKVSNLNDSGTGSLRQALIEAKNYSCGSAVVDARGVSGIISWNGSSQVSIGKDHDILILGSGMNSLTIDGQGKQEFLYHYGDANLEIDGFKFQNFKGDNIIYKPSEGDFVIRNCHFKAEVESGSQELIYFPGDDGALVIENSVFEGASSGTGAALYAPGVNSVTIRNSTFFNFSERVSYLPVQDYIAVYNSTFFNNFSPSRDGVGYWIASDSIIFINSSFVNNTCLDGTSEGAVDARSGLVKAINTTFDNNSPSAVNNIFEIVMNNSHMSNSSGAKITGSNNILDVPADISQTLGLHISEIPTLALNPLSPLIDAGKLVANHLTDQRGLYHNGNPDIGSYEYNGIVDNVGPVPDNSILSDIISCNDTVNYIEYPTATDSLSGMVTVTVDVCFPLISSVDTVVNWTFTDVHGNSTSQKQNVVIGSIPVIYLIGESNLSIPFGSVFTDPGASASDLCDGDISADIVTSGTVNTNQPGTYVLSYNVLNSLGKVAITALRNVTVNEPLDTDGDGVTDNIDKCPGTPSGVTVDAVGCEVPLSVEDNELINSIYPVPADDILSVELKDNQRINQIFFTDLNGKKINPKSFRKNRNKIDINVSNIIDGIYLLNVTTQKQINRVKVVIDRN
ncbi:MAG: immunoglobulin-like domain-containing protein [Bacteroidota bacterium]|nr:immunoglobulin-like domain-containing protein [Bacteroidota bacterium]